MMNKENSQRLKGVFFASLFLVLNVYVQAQSFDLTSPANVLQNALEKLFPYVAGIGAIWVIFKNLNHFGEGEDYWKGIKNIIIYILIVVALQQGYKYVITLQL